MAASNDRQADIVVIGGGSAGICAAVAAARNGSDVVLLEKSPLLGGMGSLAFVHTFCGLYMPDVSQPPELANPGLPTEIEGLMRSHTNQSTPVKMGRVYVLPQQPDVYDRIAKKLTAEAGVDVMLDCACKGITRDEEGFSVALGDGVIRCRSVVDCSADAVVAGFLGATRVKVESNQLQRPAMIFSINQVGDEAADDRFRMRLALDLVHAVKDGTLPEEILGATIRESPQRGEYFVSIDLDGGQWDPTDERSKAEAKAVGEKLSRKLCDFLRVRYDFFKDATDPVFAPSLGVRESFRWLGQHELSERELIDGVDFTDTVARATWPIELREDARGPKFRYFAENKPSNIPLRSLVSEEVPGVYFAGRCLSASHEALASVRVMGTCFATGQAAGIAATLYAEGVTDVGLQAQKIREQLGFS
ncbi:hypothetical protein NT6N_28050 [Oceaniferula spumae]|uniref:FAD-dependent oxidoreductase n=1 Tax=Oceaniferula spumae TaxID=2979115 RepID=A0AAT9FP19_9BACT